MIKINQSCKYIEGENERTNIRNERTKSINLNVDFIIIIIYHAQ